MTLFESLSANRRKRAFTLVELLVVIAIIGILVALLLPAVQAARESARATQCRNHLKQLALGCHNHHDTHRFFPSGGWGYKWLGDPDLGYGKSQCGGWNFSILPFIEQQNLHELGAGQTGAAKSAAFRELLTTPIPTFYCPSRRRAGLYEQRSRDNSSGQWTYNHPNDPGFIADISKCDYAFNGGPTPYRGPGNAEWHAGPNTIAAAKTHAFPPLSDSDGMLWWRSEYRMADVLDGTSNTLLIGEKGFDPAHAEDWQAGDPQSIYIGYDNDIYRHAGPNYPPHRDEPGESGAWVFTSPHLGGVVFAFGDGSVQIVRYNISLQVYGNLSHRRDGKGTPGL